jgi:hypothetical protein
LNVTLYSTQIEIPHQLYPSNSDHAHDGNYPISHTLSNPSMISLSLKFHLFRHLLPQATAHAPQPSSSPIIAASFTPFSVPRDPRAIMPSFVSVTDVTLLCTP